MQLYPAIDVQGGYAARGDGEADPVATAQALAAAGISWAHVVDLDRALGTGRDDVTVRAVIAALPGVRVQLGGGLVEMEGIRQAFGWGVRRVVVGVSESGWLHELVVAFGAERVALSVGSHSSPLSRRERGTGGEDKNTAKELVSSAASAGIRTVIYRDHDRDGTLSGANLDAAAQLLDLGPDVILAGGIASLDELRRARDLGLAGVIVGKALLTGRFTLDEAVACCG